MTRTLVERIALAASCPTETVEQTLNDYGLNLATTTRRHRSLRLDRLRIRGIKAGEIEPGTFDETFTFELGVTVIAAGNLRGKTSILEIITLILRGEGRNLQADVLSWLTGISLDAHVNGQAIGFRLGIENSEITFGKILAGTPVDLIASDDREVDGVTELTKASSAEEWAMQVGRFMLTQLGLEEIQVFNRARNDDEAGTIKSHGWPSYFSVLYPPSGADTVLLGSTASDFLPVRLLQVFLDMPEATRSMRATALAKRLESEFKSEQRRGRDARAALITQLEQARQRELDAERHLDQVRDEVPAESLQELAHLAAQTGKAMALARRSADTAAVAFGEAQQARIADEKALIVLRESRAAAALFHGLDPRFCPRCEAPIDPQRKAMEQEDNHCAVCTTTLAVGDDDDYDEREDQATAGLKATRAAEKALHAARGKAQGDLDALQLELQAIAARITKAEAARQVTERIEAEHELAAAQAVARALESMTSEEPPPPTAFVVLSQAEQVLRDDIGQAGTTLYEALSEAVRDLAISFGISELESIRVKANGQMDITKGGGARSSFSSQSPGERLRLRYALVIALLRTARTRGIAGHPGLLLLDSLKAEEVQDDHAQTLLRGLVTASEEEPGLQILVTTADQVLSSSVSGVTATIGPKPERTTLF